MLRRSIAATLILLSTPAIATEFSKDRNFSNIIEATFAYASTAQACGVIDAANYLRNDLIILLRISKNRGELTLYGGALLENIDSYISKGVRVFKSKPMISCAQAEPYYRQLHQFIGIFLEK